MRKDTIVAGSVAAALMIGGCTLVVQSISQGLGVMGATGCRPSAECDARYAPFLIGVVAILLAPSILAAWLLLRPKK